MYLLVVTFFVITDGEIKETEIEGWGPLSYPTLSHCENVSLAVADYIEEVMPDAIFNISCEYEGVE